MYNENYWDIYEHINKNIKWKIMILKKNIYLYYILSTNKSSWYVLEISKTHFHNLFIFLYKRHIDTHDDRTHGEKEENEFSWIEVGLEVEKPTPIFAINSNIPSALLLIFLNYKIS